MKDDLRRYLENTLEEHKENLEKTERELGIVKDEIEWYKKEIKRIKTDLTK